MPRSQADPPLSKSAPVAHTPGKWQVATSITAQKEWLTKDGFGWHTKVDGPEFGIALVGGTSPAEAISNARLIAAAPDLLEACKAVSGMLTSPKFVQWRTSQATSDSDWAMVSAMEMRLQEVQSALQKVGAL